MTKDNSLTLLGVPIALKPGADASRIQEALELVNERYGDQMHRFRGGQNKDILLTFTALGLADELLQLKKQHLDTQERIKNLLSKIEEAK